MGRPGCQGDETPRVPKVSLVVHLQGMCDTSSEIVSREQYFFFASISRTCLREVLSFRCFGSDVGANESFELIMTLVSTPHKFRRLRIRPLFLLRRHICSSVSLKKYVAIFDVSFS